MKIIEALHDTPLAPSIVSIYDDHVHDSSPGIAKQGLNEFLANGIGIGKYRRVYFGDDVNKMSRDIAKAHNDIEEDISDARRAERRRWDRESAEFRRTRS